MFEILQAQERKMRDALVEQDRGHRQKLQEIHKQQQELKSEWGQLVQRKSEDLSSLKRSMTEQIEEHMRRYATLEAHVVAMEHSYAAMETHLKESRTAGASESQAGPSAAFNPLPVMPEKPIIPAFTFTVVADPSRSPSPAPDFLRPSFSSTPLPEDDTDHALEQRIQSIMSPNFATTPQRCPRCARRDAGLESDFDKDDASDDADSTAGDDNESLHMADQEHEHGEGSRDRARSATRATLSQHRKSRGHHVATQTRDTMIHFQPNSLGCTSSTEPPTGASDDRSAVDYGLYADDAYREMNASPVLSRPLRSPYREGTPITPSETPMPLFAMHVNSCLQADPTTTGSDYQSNADTPPQVPIASTNSHVHALTHRLAAQEQACFDYMRLYEVEKNRARQLQHELLAEKVHLNELRRIAWVGAAAEPPTVPNRASAPSPRALLIAAASSSATAVTAPTPTPRGLLQTSTAHRGLIVGTADATPTTASQSALGTVRIAGRSARVHPAQPSVAVAGIPDSFWSPRAYLSPSSDQLRVSWESERLNQTAASSHSRYVS